MPLPPAEEGNFAVYKTRGGEDSEAPRVPLGFVADFTIGFCPPADVGKVRQLKKRKAERRYRLPARPPLPAAAARGYFQLAQQRGATPSAKTRCKAALRGRVPAPPLPPPPPPPRAPSPRYLHTQRGLVGVPCCVTSDVHGSPANGSPGAPPLAACGDVNQAEFACRARRRGVGGGAGPPWERDARWGGLGGDAPASHGVTVRNNDAIR